jgi:hypothetical protein
MPGEIASKPPNRALGRGLGGSEERFLDASAEGLPRAGETEGSTLRRGESGARPRPESSIVMDLVP